MNAIIKGTKVQTIDGFRGSVISYPTNTTVTLAVMDENDRIKKTTVDLDTIDYSSVPADRIFPGDPRAMTAAANAQEFAAWGTNGLPLPPK